PTGESSKGGGDLVDDLLGELDSFSVSDAEIGGPFSPAAAPVFRGPEPSEPVQSAEAPRTPGPRDPPVAEAPRTPSPRDPPIVEVTRQASSRLASPENSTCSRCSDGD
ncbi:unnamed protein product, partial [Polarella glacialis]